MYLTMKQFETILFAQDMIQERYIHDTGYIHITCVCDVNYMVNSSVYEM